MEKPTGRNLMILAMLALGFFLWLDGAYRAINLHLAAIPSLAGSSFWGWVKFVIYLLEVLAGELGLVIGIQSLPSRALEEEAQSEK